MTTEAVYAAEDAAFGGTDFDDELDSRRLDDLVGGITNGEWWRSCRVADVELRRARSDSTTSSARSSDNGCVVIRLATTSSSTVSHELAHALAGVRCGHEATFRAAHVDVVTVLAGSVVAARLRQAYEDHGVPVGPRRWPPPIRLRGPGFVMA